MLSLKRQGARSRRDPGSTRGRTALLLAGLSLAVTAGSVLVPVSAANAYVLIGPGCRYDPRNDDDGLGIGIDTSVTSAEATATKTGGTRWSATTWPAIFQYIGTDVSASKVDLRVSSANLGATVQATTYWWCDSGSGHYSQDPVFKWSHNQTAYTWTANNRIAVAVHEMGHSIGVNHNNSTSCNGSIAGLMYKDAIGKYLSCGWTSPSADDVNGATHAHNGQW